MNTISFRNRGLIDLRAIRTFGVSAKDCENPIGFFGTGLKYALAICARLDCQVTIYRGTERYSLVVNEIVVREKLFDALALCSDEGSDELPFTTDLGKTWEPWQAFRELYCNTIDEGGECIEGRADPLEDHTTIIVSGDPLHKAFLERHQIVLPSTPRWRGAQAEIHERESVFGYYRGIRVAQLPHRALLTYNALGGMELTEDRTLKDPSQFLRVVRDMILTSDSEELVARFLDAPSDSFEAKVDLDAYWPEPTEVFLRTVERVGFRGCANASALKVYKKHRRQVLQPDATPLNRIEEKQLASAVDFCAWARYPVSEYEIVVTADLGENIWGRAYEGRIYLNRSAFAAGTKIVAGTLIEEFIHLRHHLRDESRDLQNHLLNALVGMGELAGGEPL